MSCICSLVLVFITFIMKRKCLCSGWASPLCLLAFWVKTGLQTLICVLLCSGFTNCWVCLCCSLCELSISCSPPVVFIWFNYIILIIIIIIHCTISSALSNRVVSKMCLQSARISGFCLPYSLSLTLFSCWNLRLFEMVILSPLVSPRCVAYIGYQIMSRSHTLYIGAIAEETNKKSSCGIVQGILSSVSFPLFIV